MVGTAVTLAAAAAEREAEHLQLQACNSIESSRGGTWVSRRLSDPRWREVSNPGRYPNDNTWSVELMKGNEVLFSHLMAGYVQGQVPQALHHMTAFMDASGNAEAHLDGLCGGYLVSLGLTASFFFPCRALPQTSENISPPDSLSQPKQSRCTQNSFANASPLAGRSAPLLSRSHAGISSTSLASVAFTKLGGSKGGGSG